MRGDVLRRECDVRLGGVLRGDVLRSDVVWSDVLRGGFLRGTFLRGELLRTLIRCRKSERMMTVKKPNRSGGRAFIIRYRPEGRALLQFRLQTLW